MEETLLRLSITYGLQNSKLNRQMRFFATVNQMFGGFSLVSDYCRALGNQIAQIRSGNETVLGGSRKLEGAAEHWIGSEKTHLSVEL